MKPNQMSIAKKRKHKQRKDNNCQLKLQKKHSPNSLDSGYLCNV